MNKIVIILFFPFFLFGQSYSIDDYNLFESGLSNEFEISKNTYYNSYDTCYVEWEVIKRTMPVEWEISFCFPDCYPIGIVNSQHTFLPNQQGYLNSHIYPNNVAGEGEIEMKIVTNSIKTDTVKWHFLVTNLTSVYENKPYYFNSTYDIYDFSGKKVLEMKSGKKYLLKYRQKDLKTRVIYVL